MPSFGLSGGGAVAGDAMSGNAGGFGGIGPFTVGGRVPEWVWLAAAGVALVLLLRR